MIPSTFEEWKICIINDCKIDLTRDFAQRRLAVYQNPQDKETQKFLALYGPAHLQNVINWYQIVLKQY